jgi:hypothetical protein
LFFFFFFLRQYLRYSKSVHSPPPSLFIYVVII